MTKQKITDRYLKKIMCIRYGTKFISSIELQALKNEIAPEMPCYDWNQIIPDQYRRVSSDPLTNESSYQEWEERVEEFANIVLDIIPKLERGVTATTQRRLLDILDLAFKKFETEVQVGVHDDVIQMCLTRGVIDPWRMSYQHTPPAISGDVTWEHTWPGSDARDDFMAAQRVNKLTRRYIVTKMMLNYRIVWLTPRVCSLLKKQGRGSDPLKHYAERGILSAIKWQPLPGPVNVT